MTNFDLKTLNLADGTHSITVVAKASGYKDSEPSNAVSYVVGSGETITDLTGYTWVGNTTLLNFPLQYATYNLNFTSNNEQFTQIGTANNDDSTQEFSLIYANSTTTKYIYDFEYTSSYYSGMEAYKTIQITGGTDVTNSTLIAWLQTNGVLTKTVVEETYTIPAGTYVFNEILDATYGGNWFPLNFICNGVSYIAISDRFSETGITHNIVLRYFTTSSNYTNVYYPLEDSNGWYDEVYRTIIVETDQTVSKEFYEWFTANANIQIKAGTYTFKKILTNPTSQAIEQDLNFISNTNNYNKIYISADMYYVEYYTTSDSTMPYENEQWFLDNDRTITLSTAQTVSLDFYNWLVENTLITFTIEGTSYQAEEDMTWGEWVESEYNTGGYVVNSYGSIKLNGETSSSVAVLYNNNYVESNEVIIADADYGYGSHAGGGND